MKKTPTRVLLILTALALFVVPVAAIAAGGAFIDDDTSIFEGDIEWMAANGITLGCNPPTNDRYCPEDAVTRGQMAAFMKRLATNKVVDAATAVDSDTLDGKDSTYFLPAEVPLGSTVRGTIGALLYTPSTNDEGSANAQLPIPAPVGLADGFVTVAGGSDDTDGACTGTASSPTADPGYVCIYPYSALNAGSYEGFIWGGGDGTKWGFQVSWIAPSASKSYFFANWAYTAPTSLAGVSGATPSGGQSGVGGN